MICGTDNRDRYTGSGYYLILMFVTPSEDFFRGVYVGRYVHYNSGVPYHLGVPPLYDSKTQCSTSRRASGPREIDLLLFEEKFVDL